MRKFMILVLTTVALAAWAGAAPAQPKPAPAPRFPALDQDEAWQLLPRQDPPLPGWARILVQPQPRTTAAMLELDFLHRARNPLGPAMAGKLRWAAADAIGCAYSKQHAEADLRSAGLNESYWKEWAGELGNLAQPDRALLGFARKLTRAAYTVTDGEVDELVKLFGTDKVVAIVHTIAHANFQNRIFMALGVEVEPGGPVPPFELQLDPDKRAKVPTPARPPWEDVQEAKTLPGTSAKLDWRKVGFAELERAINRQKQRKSRIAMPDQGAIVKQPSETKTAPSRIVWSNVSMGYQPQMTKAWFDCMGTFQQEAKLDRVFANSVFWVITRSNECFY